MKFKISIRTIVAVMIVIVALVASTVSFIPFYMSSNAAIADLSVLLACFGIRAI